MRVLTDWIGKIFLYSFIVGLYAFMLIAPTQLYAKTITPKDNLHLLTISACPPDNSQIPLEVCRNTSEMVSEAFTRALSLRSENTVELVDEEAQGKIVLQQLAKYVETLNENDTLIVYLNAHGSRYGDWLEANVPDTEIRKMVSGTLPTETYTLQFWSREPVGLPPVALNNQTLIPIDQVISILGATSARVALIVDSCYAELTLLTERPNNLELLVVASGSDQVANITKDRSASLFGFALADTIARSDLATLGSAFFAAEELTKGLAKEICGTMKVSREIFETVLPDEPLPTADIETGDVALPDWYCVQIPRTFVFDNGIVSLQLN